MFEKTLTDVVKGIRASKRDTALYISQCISEIKTEINSSDMFVKANALQKLTFLQMMGYSMNWASFATIEVMSSPRFAHKRIGYLAASQGFTQDTDIVILTTNLLQKELRGALGSGGMQGSMQGVYEAGLAINCVSNIVTQDLARDLLADVVKLTSHPQPYLRKKAILCLFKMFVQYPQGLRLTFDQLQTCLQDSNPAVVSCAVNVITELSDKNPNNYLHLAPAFFELLTASSNNWMLIKVVKLLGSLVPEEPRLARKLLEPLANIVKSTQAKSLLYEAVHTITLCLPYCRKSDGSMPAIVPEIVHLSALTLRSLVQEQDQNLKYLGLVGFASLLQSHPKVLQTTDGTRPLILACLSDQDVTIRTRALDLLVGLASRKNLVELVSQLLTHVPLARASYKLDLVSKILEMCSKEKYALLGENNFSWFFDVLIQLGHMRGIEQHADLLHDQLTNVALRVLPVRSHAVRKSMEVLLAQATAVSMEEEQSLLGTAKMSAAFEDNGRGKDIMPELLPSLAWIVGEYSNLIPDATAKMDASVLGNLPDPHQGYYHAMIQVLSAPHNVKKLSTSTQKVFLQAIPKILSAGAETQGVQKKQLEASIYTIQLNIPIYLQSVDVEVVERSFTIMETLRSLDLLSLDSSVPEMAKLDDESDDDDDPSAGISSDILGLDSKSNADEKTGSFNPMESALSNTSSLGSKVKEASSTLSFLFKASPMKPTGSKAQRKKQTSPVGHSVNLEASIDLSAFASFLEEEEEYRQSNKLTMESISFSQQRPHQASTAAPTQAVGQQKMIGISSEDAMPLTTSASGIPFQSTNNSAEGSSFQNPLAQQHQERRNDPFYLASSASGAGASGNDNGADETSANRLGIIQLPDDDGEEETAINDKKSKKKKKKKDRKSEAAFSNDQMNQAFGPMDLSGFGNQATASPSVAESSAPAILNSDDDEDDAPGSNNGFGGRARKKANKEFAGLSKVDITKPLREDEVLPAPKHYEVPERGAAPAAFEEPKKSKKELKKQKKEAKRKKKEQAQTAGSTNAPVQGDLLDLFGASPAADAHVAPSPPSQSTSADAIGSAFDDLLGMTAPAPALKPADDIFAPAAPQQNVGLVEPSKGSNKSKKLWMKLPIKTEKALGSPVDWSQVRISTRVYHTGPASVMLKLRLENQQSGAPLNNLSLHVGDSNPVHLGSAAPSSSTETSKFGPFALTKADQSQELKATMRWADNGSVPMKLIIPASMHLSPQDGLSLDSVANELASEPFVSSSAKVAISSRKGIDIEAVKKAIGGFLNAGNVAESSPNPMAATLAATSSTGAKVRILLKLKSTSLLKVDFRCTNQSLADSLASDMKKVIFEL